MWLGVGCVLCNVCYFFYGYFYVVVFGVVFFDWVGVGDFWWFCDGVGKFGKFGSYLWWCGICNYGDVCMKLYMKGYVL